MSDETKRIVAEETWVSEGSKSFFRDRRSYATVRGTAAFYEPSAVATIAACAPEALRLLLEAGPGDGDTCRWCGATDMDQSGTEHTPDCAWLALMRKAGLR